MITIPGRIPVTIQPLFWLVALLIGWVWTFTLSGTLLCVLVILFSVLFHEFGHAMTAMLFGQKTRIELAAFGGFTYREGRKLKLWEEFLVVLNGPIAGFLLFLIGYAVFRYVPIHNQLLLFVVKFTFTANLFWTVINLVPVLPLDGGHLLSIVLEGIFGFKGVKMAIIVGLVIAVAICAFFFIIGMFLVGALFLILTFESFRSLRYYKLFTEKDRDAKLQEQMRTADQAFQEGKTKEAETMLEGVRNQTKEGILFTVATQELASIYRQQERYEEAYQILLPIRSTLTGESLVLFHFLAYMNGDYKMVAEIAGKCFQENPAHNTALINALAYAALEEAEPAVGWLECAEREGLPSIKEAMAREEFNNIRNDPRFRSLAERVSHA